ncbi:hypothetical protein [Streptomyces boninensis]|uniref:hypothetical protein n=1 Tax=Streptomyces boninensis TaxID=2039455 RepID=UPI003B227EBF
MSQAWPQQPQQPNPYGGHPQQPAYGYPQAAPPVQPGLAYQPGFPPPPPRRGNPVGAFFLALLVSVVLSGIYSMILLASYEDLSKVGLKTSYVIFGLVLALAVGAVAGKVGGPSTGAHICAAVLAALGAFFGFTNGYVAILIDAADFDLLGDMLEEKPFFPAEAWWKGLKAAIALPGIFLAAIGTWGMAHLTGKRRG